MGDGGGGGGGVFHGLIAANKRRVWWCAPEASLIKCHTQDKCIGNQPGKWNKNRITFVKHLNSHYLKVNSIVVVDWISKIEKRVCAQFCIPCSSQFSDGLCMHVQLVGVMFRYTPRAPLLTCLTLIPAWIGNYINHKVWHEITNQFLNFNGATVEL